MCGRGTVDSAVPAKAGTPQRGECERRCDNKSLIRARKRVGPQPRTGAAGTVGGARDTWDQRDEIHHPPLRWGGPSIEHPFTLADEAEMQALPGYWLEKQAGIAARWVK